MANTNNTSHTREEQLIFGPLPKRTLRSWNLFFIILAGIFLTTAWYTRFPEKLDCSLHQEVGLQAEQESLTVIALNKNFDFRKLSNQQQVSLRYLNEHEQVSITVNVQAINQSVIEQELQILLRLQSPQITTSELAAIQQAGKLTLVIEDNRLLEQLIAPIKAIASQHSKT